MSRSGLRLMVTTTLMLLLAALAGKLVVYGDVQTPSALPRVKGGFTPVRATLETAPGGILRPALAVVERRVISPSRASPIDGSSRRRSGWPSPSGATLPPPWR